MPRRPTPALSLAAAAALAAACGSDPLGPSTSAAPAAARPSAATGRAPSRFAAIEVKLGSASAGAPLLGGATVAFATDKATTTVADNSAADGDGAAGRFSALIPQSTGYKARLVSVPAAYYFAPGAVNGAIGADGVIQFAPLVAARKPTVGIEFRDEAAQLVSGATVVVTSPGMDYQFVLTDGGAGDLTPGGKQAPADGRVTFYAPAPYFAEWKVCEQAPPAGYRPAEPGCRTAKTTSAAPDAALTFTHLTGTVEPPAT